MRNLALPHANSDHGPLPDPVPHRDRPRSSDRVLQLLTAVGSSPHGMSLTEAAAAAGLVPSTALRQLRSLEASGLVVRADDQVYRAGPQLVELARTVFVGHSLTELAQPFLDALAESSGESTYIAVAHGGRSATYVATAPGQHALRHSGWLGRAFPTASTAVGAALRDRIDDDGAVARADTLEAGITAVSAPVRSSVGVVAAINVVGPSFRLVDGELARVRALVVSTCADLSRRLGHP